MEEAKNSFEDQWNAAFEGAEMSPSEHVWTSIDGILANEQATGYKKRILFFKWLAAASVSIAILAISALWIQNLSNEVQLVENTPSKDQVISKENNQLVQAEDQPSTNEAKSTLGQAESTTNYIAQKDSKSNSNENTPNTNTPKLLVKNDSDASIESFEKGQLTNDSNEAILVDNNDVLTKPLSLQLAKLDPKQVNTSSILEPFQASELYGVANPYLSSDFEIKNDDFSLWAGVSMSAGTFNPNSGNNSDQMLNFASVSDNPIEALFSNDGSVSFSEILNEETLNSGSSLSVGLDLRGKISDRFVLSSGIHYLKNNSSLASSITISDTNTGDSFAVRSEDLNNGSLQNAVANGSFSAQNSSTNFNNGLEYLSIPFKAGYMILDKKFNVILNSGFSTNFLLNAQLNSSSGQTKLFNHDNSFSDEFKPVYFNFLTSIELGYTFKEKYFFSVEPNYSQALTDFTKSESSFSGRPNNFGVSIGIKYNF